MDKPKSPNMEVLKRRAFDVCLVVYRLTAIFPKNEALSNQLRDASGRIAASLAAGRISDTISKIEEIKIFLSIARCQNWAGPMNFDLLLNAYGLLAEALSMAGTQKAPVPHDPQIATPPPVEKKKAPAKLPVAGDNIRRQKIITNFFKENGEATVPQLAKILSNVTERTVRADIAELVLRKVLVKNGGRRGARYFLHK